MAYEEVLAVYLEWNGRITFGPKLDRFIPSMWIGIPCIFPMHILWIFPYPPCASKPDIGTTVALSGIHTTPDYICRSIAAFNACSFQGIVLVLLAENLLQVVWIHFSFSRNSLSSLLQSSPLGFFTTHSNTCTRFVVTVDTCCAIHFGAWKNLIIQSMNYSDSSNHFQNSRSKSPCKARIPEWPFSKNCRINVGRDRIR